MKKIIVYGVKNLELRRSIEYFLDDHYKIVGYTDGHYEYDVLDNQKFFRLEELCHQEFDFIVIASSSGATQSEIRRILLALNIPSEKIIRPTMFRGGSGEKGQTDLIANIDNHYCGEKSLIFGMSYSAWGIREKELKHSFYNCSWSGLDLYYNYCMYRYIEEHPCFLNIDTVLLVFPYYYFDYDMSRSFGQYESGQIFSIRRLDDWHHSDQVSGAYDYIANYRMFGEKITRFYHMPKWKGESPYTLKEPDGGILLDPLWFADHGETVEENQEIFVQFYKSIESRRGTPAIVIPPFYLEGLNLVSKTAF